jgi:hypothetical protein
MKGCTMLDDCDCERCRRRDEGNWLDRAIEAVADFLDGLCTNVGTGSGESDYSGGGDRGDGGE